MPVTQRSHKRAWGVLRLLWWKVGRHDSLMPVLPVLLAGENQQEEHVWEEHQRIYQSSRSKHQEAHAPCTSVLCCVYLVVKHDRHLPLTSTCSTSTSSTADQTHQRGVHTSQWGSSTSECCTAAKRLGILLKGTSFAELCCQP
jgi:hypothetical protein